MKDETPETPENKLPFCPFSVHCERLLEDLDKKTLSFQDDAFQFADDAKDRQLLMQLQAHLPGCPTCTSILSHARIRRFQQRQQIQRFLFESEQKVSSTTAQIMYAIARERRGFPKERAINNGQDKVMEEVKKAFPGVPVRRTVQQPRSASRSRRRIQNVLAFVAVLAVILASFSLFSHMLLLRQPSSHEMSHSPQPGRGTNSVSHSTTWSSVIITSVKNGQEDIASIDPVTGRSVVLASSRYPDGTTLDGVAHDGYQVLYHVFDGHVTRYYLQPSILLYTTNGKGGAALWSTDDSSIFISTPEGIEQVDVNAHTHTLITSKLQGPDLRFYRSGYLYFMANASKGLNRINLATGEVTAVTTNLCPFSYDFWLDTSGKQLYYRCKTDPTLLYSVGSDGSGSQIVRTSAGSIIGYNSQGYPLTLLRVTSTYQVIMLIGNNAQYDQTIVADVAHGASDLPAVNVAVGPYGFSLLALAHYPGGVGKIWYDDLVGHKQMLTTTLSDTQLVSSLQLVGWARLQVPASSPLLGQ